MTLVIPMVTWQDAREEWVVDIYSRLLQDRIIFVGTPIDEQIDIRRAILTAERSLSFV